MKVVTLVGAYFFIVVYRPLAEIQLEDSFLLFCASANLSREGRLILGHASAQSAP